jgi:hypothetical protein
MASLFSVSPSPPANLSPEIIHASICSLLVTQAKDSAAWAAYAERFMSQTVQDALTFKHDGTATSCNKKNKARAEPPSNDDGDFKNVSIKICSMDGSSIVTTVAKEAMIRDVKASVMDTLKLAIGSTLIRLHIKDVEDQLDDAQVVGPLFGAQEPVLFMFQETPNFETVKQLDSQMESLVDAQVARLEGCFEAMRASSDGESCQICQWRTGEVDKLCSGADGCSGSDCEDRTTLQKCGGRCGLLVCSVCRPQMCRLCRDEDCHGEGLLSGRCCEACWTTKFKDKCGHGTCSCNGCANTRDKRDARRGSQRGSHLYCREEYCADCADEEDNFDY